MQLLYSSDNDGCKSNVQSSGKRKSEQAPLTITQH
jgi:hypothetical protein